MTEVLLLPLYPRRLGTRQAADYIPPVVLMCACCYCVYMIKMTYPVNWIIVRERRAESTSLSPPERQDSVKTSGAKPGCSG